MCTPLSAAAQLTNFRAFRQALYATVLRPRRAAQFEVLAALLVPGSLRAVAELSTGPLFRRGGARVYAAWEDGRLDTGALRRLLAAQLPACARPAARRGGAGSARGAGGGAARGCAS